MDEFTVLILEDKAGFFFNLSSANQVKAIEEFLATKKEGWPKLKATISASTVPEVLEKAKIEAESLSLKVRGLND
ncbi:MAG: hypothetical protein Q8L36_03600 [bacterium]|nr:hypothetical protein [bacterium]